MDYSKWDNLDSGSEDEGPALSAAAVFGEKMLTEWLMLATPDLSAEEVS